MFSQAYSIIRNTKTIIPQLSKPILSVSAILQSVRFCPALARMESDHAHPRPGVVPPPPPPNHLWLRTYLHYKEMEPHRSNSRPTFQKTVMFSSCCMIGKEEGDISQDDARKGHMSNTKKKVYVVALGCGWLICTVDAGKQR